MEGTAPEAAALWPLGVYFGAVIVIVTGMVGLSAVLGERHQARARNQPYESGVIPTGSARTRFPAHFYLVAMLFVIFDLETIYLLAWAVAVREAGWLGFAEMAVFVLVLLAAWLYLWRVGALDWGTSRRRGPAHPPAVGEHPAQRVAQ